MIYITESLWFIYSYCVNIPIEKKQIKIQTKYNISWILCLLETILKTMHLNL